MVNNTCTLFASQWLTHDDAAAPLFFSIDRRIHSSSLTVIMFFSFVRRQAQRRTSVVGSRLRLDKPVSEALLSLSPVARAPPAVGVPVSHFPPPGRSEQCCLGLRWSKGRGNQKVVIRGMAGWGRENGTRVWKQEEGLKRFLSGFFFSHFFFSYCIVQATAPSGRLWKKWSASFLPLFQTLMLLLWTSGERDTWESKALPSCVFWILEEYTSSTKILYFGLNESASAFVFLFLSLINSAG